MPNPIEYADEKEWMGVCVPRMMEEGREQDQAVAACLQMWRDKGAKEEAVKVGARNSRDDRGRVRAIRKAASDIVDHTKAMEPNDEDPKPEPIIMGSKPIKGDMEALFISLPDIPGAVKTLGDWELEVLGVPFGGPDKGKDSDGQYFSKNTNTYKEYFKTIPVFYYHGINPDGKSVQPDLIQIGTAKYSHTDKLGQWFKVTLDRTVEFAKRIWEAAKRGIARASSGSLSHLVRIEKSGEIMNWPVAELSLIDAQGKRQPANAWAVATPLIKAHYDKAHLEYPVIPSDEDDNISANLIGGAQGAGEAPERTDSEAAVKANLVQGENQMDEKEVKDVVASAVADAMKAQAEANVQATKAEAERQALIDAEVTKKVEAVKAEYVKAGRLPFAEGVTIAKNSDIWKYDNLDAGDQAVMLGVLEAAKKPAGESAYKALATKLEEDKGEVGEIGRRAMKAAGIKANEINYSTTALGAEWIGDAYSASLWEMIRVGTFAINKLPQIEVPQGYDSIYLPLESTDPVWYKVAEAATSATGYSGPTPTVTASAIATGQTQLTLAKLGARVVWSGELNEDSLVPFAPQLRSQMAKSGAEYLESAIIDGDTETTDSTNINNIGGAEVTGGHYLAFNGFRKSCLVTTTANSRAGGSLSVEDFLETCKLMGGAGINALDTSKVSFIIDPNVNWKFISLPEFLTRDVAGNPTLEGGKLTQIWGYGVDVSGSMHFMSSVRKANSAGKVNTTDTTANLYGAILAVRWDQWKFGWKRRMTIETTRFANSDTNEIVAMIRVGLKQRDTEASAISYGISV